MNIIVSQSVIDAIPWIVSTLKKMGFPQLAVENCKTGIIATIRQHFMNLSAHMPGYCRYDIPGKKYRFIFRYRMSNDRTKALLTGVSIGKKELHEQKRKVIRLTEADIRHCIRKVMLRLLEESFIHPLSKPMKIGEYDAIDGTVWETIQPGLEHKGGILELCFYVKGTEGIGLFQVCKTGKYFYAKIKQISDKKSIWKSIKKTEVPEAILSDFPHCLRRLREKRERAIQALL